MRCLTARNLWPWAIIHGGCDVLNWSEPPVDPWLGEVAIHVSRAHGDEPAIRYIIDRLPLTTNPRLMSPGHVIGLVQLVDVHPQAEGCCDSPWAEKSYAGTDARAGRAVTHLVLERPRALAHPVPALGHLGLWTPDGGLRDRIDVARRESAVR